MEVNSDGQLTIMMEKKENNRATCPILISDVTEAIFWRKWIFFGITYHEITEKFYCVLQDSSVSTIDMKMMVEETPPVTQGANPGDLSVGADDTVFQIDDIVYSPRYFGVMDFQYIFDKSK